MDIGENCDSWEEAISVAKRGTAVCPRMVKALFVEKWADSEFTLEMGYSKTVRDYIGNKNRMTKSRMNAVDFCNWETSGIY